MSSYTHDNMYANNQRLIVEILLMADIGRLTTINQEHYKKSIVIVMMKYLLSVKFLECAHSCLEETFGLNFNSINKI